MPDSIIFWCEFPEKTNWEVVNKLIDFRTSIYVAVKSKKEFRKYKSKIKNKNIELGAWPTIGIEEGYWFSSYSSKDSLAKLNEFKGIPIKVDLEPPIFKGEIKPLSYISYFLKYFIFGKGKNEEYLRKQIEKVKSNAILSTFPFPDFLLKNAGANFSNKYERNFFIYTTLVPRLLRPIGRLYYQYFVKNKLKQDPEARFAIGCTGPGIFGNEGFYKTIKQFKKDMGMASSLNIKNLVIFEIASLSNKKDSKAWFELISSYIRLNNNNH